MTFGEPGIEPAASRFQVRGPTHWGILASQNCSSGGFLCIKNTKSVRQISRMRTCAWFFPCQNSARLSFSAAKIARPRFFRGQNSPPKVFPRPKEGGGEGGSAWDFCLKPFNYTCLFTRLKLQRHRRGGGGGSQALQPDA